MAQLQNGQLTPSTESDVDFDTGRGCYRPEQRPYDASPPVKVIIVGAGIGGITASILLSRKVKNLSYVVFERNDAVSGTWTQNRYPGVRCDVPSHAYQLTFAPNTQWSEYYAPGAEIRAYYERVTREYGVSEHLRLRHEVLRAVWSEATSRWEVEVENLETGEIHIETADFFVSAAGRLNVPRWPQIPGLDTEYKGRLCHTAAWDTRSDVAGKSVAIIGNGASGQQLMANILPRVARVDHYARSKQWILPTFTQNLIEATGELPGGYVFSQGEKNKFAEDREAYLEYRRNIEVNLHGDYRGYLAGTAQNQAMRQRCLDTMLRRLGGNEKWLERLIPDYAPGCKRLTPAPGYLEALMNPNVDYVETPISHATAEGLVTADGKERKVDVVVAATGFQNGFLPLFPTIGKKGIDLAQRWASDGPIGYPETYFGVMAPDMPNYFAVLQAQSYGGGGTLPLNCEMSATYIAKVIRKVQSQGYKAIHPSHEATADFNEIVSGHFENSVIGDNCNSWLKSGGGKSRVLLSWPGSGHHRFDISRDPRWEDFVFEWSAAGRRNRFEYFGNGSTEREKEGGLASMTKYLKEVGQIDLTTLHEAWND